MSKLKLTLESLAVESFDTTAIERATGTVFGEQQCTCQTICSCPGCPSCDNTCAYTCDDATCAGQGTCVGGTCEGTCWKDGCGMSQWETCPARCPASWDCY